MAHTTLDGALESCANIFFNLCDIVAKPAEPYAEPLNGKVCIVTGANAGIGFATAQQLVNRGAHVVLACRDMARANEAAKAIARSPPLPGCSPGSVEALPLDLSRLASVNEFAGAWRARQAPLHLLVCNAGIMAPALRLQSHDGLEMQFQVNFLSHWLLAMKLLEVEHERRARVRQQQRQQRQQQRSGSGGRGSNALAAGAAAADGGPGTRVVMVSSLTHRAGLLQWADMLSEAGYDPLASYGLSKLANLMSAKELQRRFDSNRAHWAAGGDCAVAVHPGLVDTHLANGFFRSYGTGWAEGSPLERVVKPLVHGFLDTVAKAMLRTPEQSSRWMLHACLAPPSQVAGRYLAMGMVAQPDKVADSKPHARELWAVAERLTAHTPHRTLALPAA